MENIVASLLLLCGQLNVAGLSQPYDQKVIESRQKCIQRVAECAKKKVVPGRSLTWGESALDCAVEVY